MTIRLIGGVLVLGAFAMTLGWGYEQRQQAQQWRERACAYRFADLASRAPFLGADGSRAACDRLESLGVGVPTARLATLPRRGAVTRQ